MPVLHTSDAALAATLSPVLTVEAEYGAVVIEGSRYTAAHHQPSGPFAGDHVVAGGRPAPCNDAGIPRVERTDVILVSHIDLDTVGGVLRGLGAAEDPIFVRHPSFWALAAFIDCNGVHKRGLANAAQDDLDRMDAWWAWSHANVPRLPREGVTDVTDTITSCYEALVKILGGDEFFLAAGRQFRDAEAKINADSFVGMGEGGVIHRRAPEERSFVNHLYVAPSGEVGRAIVAHNPHAGNITISLADPIPGVSCRDIVQGLWGPLAGGHAGIAGSPRGQVMSDEDVSAVVKALTQALSAL
jgi:hypothetical protein